MSLVLWITWFQRDNPHVNFVDDNSAFNQEGDVLWYEPYHAFFPAGQTKLLLLWDEIGLPHKQVKQTNGVPHPYIGINIDPNAIMAMLPESAQHKLIDELRRFCDIPPGHPNWAFNVYPLLKPALSNVYAKIAGKRNPHSGIYVNTRIIADLRWMIHHVEHPTGVSFLGATH
ncbi:hypothetical protein BKA93DRAFT_741228 [Sparassis latifolia]